MDFIYVNPDVFVGVKGPEVKVHAKSRRWVFFYEYHLDGFLYDIHVRYMLVNHNIC